VSALANPVELLSAPIGACSPKSYLGKIVLSGRDAETGILIPIKAHFDGSYSGVGSHDATHMALAGFAIGDALLDEFDRGWNAVLQDDRFRPSVDYLHMKQLRSDSKDSPYSKDKGWDNAKRERLVLDVVDYLAQQDKTRLHYFVCGVDCDAVRKRQAVKPFPSPVRICNHYCPHYILEWYGKDYPGVISSMNVFFDGNEPFAADFAKLRALQTSNRFEIYGNREIWQLMKSQTSLYSANEVPSLQAADLLAWGTLRQMKSPQSPFLKHIAVIVKRALSSSWARWNDSNLDEIKVPFLPEQK
jgi:hypothetical protein